MTNLLFPLLLGHFLGDFVLQTDKMANVKKEAFSLRKLRILGLHVFIHFCLYFLAVLGYWFVGGTTDIWLLMGMIVGISLLHLVIDLVKAPVERVLGDSSLVRLCTYVGDQLLHVLIIFLAVRALAPISLDGLSLYAKICALACLLIVIVYFVGYLIPYILEVLMPGFNNEKRIVSITKVDGKILLTKNQELAAVTNKELKAGRYIGGLERLLLLIFMALQIYSAISIIVALKTLARFKDLENNRAFAEYYLIGNFLSMIFGVLIGIVFNYVLLL
ncbi:DUF3307 domain-containing protein [Listeria booriae]|uniref:DUF3307 domain-containing protein n=1 Tax=Listeria booriae TaxID=1552123 RepID=UPI00162876D2|nr:DUF3307 domain-containing protein [Listeria booriae]MBC1975610.1 DUF3307 domain-containing protein [Listeria booriae]MBC2033429.1 DUF3307 domain-containing protein [Listeria booriae]